MWKVKLTRKHDLSWWNADLNHKWNGIAMLFYYSHLMVKKDLVQKPLKASHCNWHCNKTFGLVPSSYPNPSAIRENPLWTCHCWNVKWADWTTFACWIRSMSVSVNNIHKCPQSLCSPPSISYEYPWTIGAAYPTTVPHSQSDTAGSPAHLDPACQSHSTYPALRHGVPPGRTMGGLGRQHSCWGDGASGSRPDPGETHWGDPPPPRAESHQDGGCPATMNCLSQVRDTRKCSHWLEGVRLNEFVLPFTP